MVKGNPESGMKLYASNLHPHREEGELVGTITQVLATTLNFKHAEDLRIDSVRWHLYGHLNKFYDWR